MALTGRDVANRTVGIDVVATDNASGVLNKVQRGLKDFGKGLALGQIGQGMENLGKKILGVGVAAGKMSIDFNASFSKIGPLTGRLGVSLEQARQHVLRLSGATGQSATDLADALYFVGSAGLKASQVMPVLDDAAKGAAIGMGSAADVGRSLITVLNAYRGTQLNANQAMNIFTESTKLSTAEVGDFATGLGPVVGIAAQAGIRLQDLASAISQATNVGIPFSRAVTGLRFLISNLQAPTAGATAALKSYGISAQSVYTALHQPGGLEHELQFLADRFDLTTARGREAWRAVTGGARGAIVATTLVGTQTGATNIILNTMNKLGTATSDVFGRAFELIKQRNPQLAMDMLKAKIHAVVIELGDNLLPVGYKLLDLGNKLIGWVQSIDPHLRDLIFRGVLIAGAFLLIEGKALVLVGALYKLRAILAFTNISFLELGATVGIVMVSVLAFAAAAAFVITHWSRFKPFFMDAFNSVRKVGVTAIDDIRHWWDQNGTAVINQAVKIAQAITRFLVQAFKTLVDIGRAVAPFLVAFGKAVAGIAPYVIDLATFILKVVDAIVRVKPLVWALIAAFIAWKAIALVGWIVGVLQAIQGFSGGMAILGAWQKVVQQMGLVTTGTFEEVAVAAETSAASVEASMTGMAASVGAANAEIRAGLAGASVEGAGALGGLEEAAGGAGLALGGLASVAIPAVGIALGVGLAAWVSYRKHVADTTRAVDNFAIAILRTPGSLPGVLPPPPKPPRVAEAPSTEHLWVAYRKALALYDRQAAEVNRTVAAQTRVFMRQDGITRSMATSIARLTGFTRNQKIGLVDLISGYQALHGKLTSSQVDIINTALRAGDLTTAEKFLKMWTDQANTSTAYEKTVHDRAATSLKEQRDKLAALNTDTVTATQRSKELARQKQIETDKHNATATAVENAFQKLHILNTDTGQYIDLVQRLPSWVLRGNPKLLDAAIAAAKKQALDAGFLFSKTGKQHAGGFAGEFSGAHMGMLAHNEIPAILERGEFVVNKHATSMFAPILHMLNKRTPRFHDGGSVGNLPDVLSGLASAVRGLSPTGSPSLEAMLKFGSAWQAPVPAFSALGVNVPGSVTQWIVRALGIDHEPMSWLSALQVLVGRESGGNARAVNPTAVLGQHATGIAQMLPSTFAANMLRPYTNILNPIDNLVSAIRYIARRYGSPFNIPGLLSGHYSGYEHGGTINEPVVGVGLNSGQGYKFAEKGPENVGQKNEVHLHLYGDVPRRQVSDALQELEFHRLTTPGWN